MAQAPVVGLDIGSQLMKAVELHVSAKEGLCITAMAVAPTPPGVLQNGMLTDPQLMAQAVKQMLKDGGIRAKKVIGCIAGQSSVVVRIIEVPRMTPTELAETMKWEVERHVPFAPTDVQMDYKPLPITDPNDQNPNMSVLLAVAQKDMVNYYVEMLFKAGLDPIAIDIEPLAAARALLDIDNGVPIRRNLNPIVMPDGNLATADLGLAPSEHETVAVVNIGASNTDISIFEDGMLIFPRSLALAGESLTKAISEGMGYQIDQAERIKIENAQVLMERVLDYGNQTGFQQEQVEFPYGQPGEQSDSMRPVGLPDSGPLGRSVFDSAPLPRNPFDSGPIQPRSPFDSTPVSGRPNSDRINSGPLGGTSPFDMDPNADPNATVQSGDMDLERTQPIQRRTLDLARRGSIVPDDPSFTSVPSPNDPDSLTSQVFDSIAPVLSELAQELRRSLDYYRSRSTGKNVDRILLCGGTASLPGLDKYLDHELQVPVQLASPLTGFTVTTKNFDPRYLQTIAPLFVVAIGLAARNAVFAANPLPKATKTKAKAAGSTGSSDAVVSSKSKKGFTLPAFNLGKSKKGDQTSGQGGTTTLPPGS